MLTDMVAMRLAGYLSVEYATSNGGDASREYFSGEDAPIRAQVPNITVSAF